MPIFVQAHIAQNRAIQMQNYGSAFAGGENRLVVVFVRA
jgi:hypothetical protein